MEDQYTSFPDLAEQLQAFGIHATDDIIRTGNISQNLSWDETQEKEASSMINFVAAEIQHVTLEGFGIIPCLISANCRVYEFVRTLRKCIYGKVKHAVELQMTPTGNFVRTSNEFAIKIMSKAIIEEGNLQENPLVELATQEYLSRPGHPNVLSLIDCLHDNNFIYAVLPFCSGGELFSIVETGGAMCEDHCRHWFAQIVSGLAFLQSRYICHRDMSLENILLHGNEAKIIDFGLCIQIPVDAHGMTYSLPPAGAVGKLFYMSPEIYRNRVPFNGFASDIWSAGVMLFIMITGAPPFERPDEADPRFRLISSGKLSKMLDSWGMHHVSSSARDLLSRMLVVDDPQKRFTIEQVASHPWFRGG